MKAVAAPPVRVTPQDVRDQIKIAANGTCEKRAEEIRKLNDLLMSLLYD